MIDLIISLAMFFLVSFILLPCFVVLAMSIRGITMSRQKHELAGLENRRARNSTRLAAIPSSLRSSSSVGPIRTGEGKDHRLPAHPVPLQST